MFVFFFLFCFFVFCCCFFVVVVCFFFLFFFGGGGVFNFKTRTPWHNCSKLSEPVYSERKKLVPCSHQRSKLTLVATQSESDKYSKRAQNDGFLKHKEEVKINSIFLYFIQ